MITIIALLHPTAVLAEELRCGWYLNPTPANHWLEDADGTWILATQGGYQVWETVDLAEQSFAFDDQWVSSNGEPGHAYYGHGCACIRGIFEPTSGRVSDISHMNPRPLDACRTDPNLPPEPNYQ
ncbi:DUF4087 domain-containing protein [Yoonia sp. F2084L]|nr:DUF4087 domain-containing protein [Yoonia sp. F2084L]